MSDMSRIMVHVGKGLGLKQALETVGATVRRELKARRKSIPHMPSVEHLGARFAGARALGGGVFAFYYDIQVYAGGGK